MNITMTENEFINDEIRVWGFDIIESLLDRGFTPIRTTVGWKWLAPPINTPINSTKLVEAEAI